MSNINRFEHGKEPIKIAKNKGLRIRYSDHVIVYSPNNPNIGNPEHIAIPNKPLKTGLGVKIFKWYLKWGLIPTLIYSFINTNL